MNRHLSADAKIMNQRRPRGRNNNSNNNNNNNRGRHQNTRNQTFDSNGPEGRVRGSATQVLERYLAQARDAQAAGDGVLAENLFQHAEHYYRVLSVANAQMEQQRERNAPNEDRRGGRGDNQDSGRNENDGEAENRQNASEAREDNRDSDTREDGRRAKRDDDEDSDEKNVARAKPDPAPSDDVKADDTVDAESSEGELDAAFLKPPPKPRRRRRPAAEAETEAAD